MDDNNKEPEKMNKNEEMQAVEEEDLQSVAGGGLIDTFKEKWDRFRMSEQEKKEIISLITEYNSLSQRIVRRTTVLAYGGPSWFDENDRSRKRLEEIKNKLRVYAKKYPNIPELKPFLD